jgi:hypothetical protein
MRLLIAIVAVVSASTSAIAGNIGPPIAPPCVFDTLDDYITLGAGGCTVGQFTFSNFSFATISSAGGADPISPSAITVTPSPLGSNMALRFFSDSGFSVTGAEEIEYELAYIVDPPPIIFRFADDLETLTPVAPGVVQITTEVCATVGVICPPGTIVNVTVFHDGVNFKLSDSAVFPLSNFLEVVNRITLNANGASADFKALTNTSTFVPEPGTAIVAGAGLAALLAIRSRRSRSAARASESRQV